MITFVVGVVAGVIFRPAFITMKDIAVKLWKEHIPKE
jgi:hypothetical protein